MESLQLHISSEECSEEMSFDEMLNVVRNDTSGFPFQGSIKISPVKTPTLVLVQPTASPTKNNSCSAADISPTNTNTVTLDEDIDVVAFKENVSRNRKKSRKPEKSKWKREISKRLRMQDNEYDGYTTKKCGETGKVTYIPGVPKDKKELRPRCNSSYCTKRKQLSCNEFTEDDRKEIFESFWKNMDWIQKKSYACSLIDIVPVKRKSGKATNRKDTYLYYLKLNERKVQVCHKEFLNTLGLGKFQLLTWIRKSRPPNSIISPAPKVDRQAPRRQEAHDNCKSFLALLPKLPSHYARSESTKLYLEPTINSKNELYHIYKEHCTTNNLRVFSRTQFMTVLDKENIAIFAPRKDQCDICETFNSGQLSEAVWNEHRQKKNLARNEKTKDKALALEGKAHVLTMDLQSVKLSPLLKASTMYYKTKLAVHNFTVYNLKTKDAVCYWWNETEADLSSSTFASCLRDYIKLYIPNDGLPIIIFSDGCTSQNRNIIMANALLDVAVTSKREIFQKFLERGHTQMECDSVHSAIEAELKNKPIYIPTDYIKITCQARSRQPYLTKYVKYDFFEDFSMKKNQRYYSLRPGEKKGDPCVVDIKNIKYCVSGEIQYKLNYEEPWKDLPQSKNKFWDNNFPPLFNSQRKISARKYKDLQDLKNVIPVEYHLFYDNLSYK